MERFSDGHMAILENVYTILGVPWFCKECENPVEQKIRQEKDGTTNFPIN